MNLNEHATLEKFHAEGLMALRGEKPDLQPRKRLQMMDKMPEELRSLDMFREAFISNAVLFRGRAAAVNKQLSSLRRSRENSGKAEQFREFEKMVETCLDGVTIGPHGYRTRQLEDTNADKVFTEVRKIIDVLDGLGYSAFANAGTLLGIVRDRGLIAHDDDIDLAVILTARKDAEAAEEFKILLGRLLAEGLDCHLVPGKNAIIKLPKIDGFQVDLFPAYGARQGYNIYPYSRKQLVFADIWPLKTCDLSGLPLPARPEVVLKVNYGEGWKIPDPRYALQWVPMKRKFSALLNAMGTADAA